MKQCVSMISLLILTGWSCFAEPAVIGLVDGTYGRGEIVDVSSVRDSTVTMLRVKTNGVVSEISKKRISFIILNSDTLFFRDLASTQVLELNENNKQFRFGRSRALWVSGSFSYSAMSITGLDASQKLLSVSPAIRFFANKEFFIGPRLQWTGVYGPVSSVNEFGAGLDLGVLGAGETPVVFYLRTGFLVNVQQYNSESVQLEPAYAYGVSWPIGIGMFIRLSQELSLQIEPGYQINVTKNSTEHHFLLSIGFAGTGRKYCVSTMQILSSVWY